MLPKPFSEISYLYLGHWCGTCFSWYQRSIKTQITNVTNFRRLHLLGEALHVLGHGGVAHDVGVRTFAVIARVDGENGTLRHVKNFLLGKIFEKKTWLGCLRITTTGATTFVPPSIAFYRAAFSLLVNHLVCFFVLLAVGSRLKSLVKEVLADKELTVSDQVLGYSQ